MKTVTIPAYWSDRPVIDHIRELIEQGYSPRWTIQGGVPVLIGEKKE